MIEFLQPLVDIVSKALPAFANKRSRDNAARLGSELFLVYVQLNEALVTAEEIVTPLETYLQRVTGDPKDDPSEPAWNPRRRVASRVREQLENLKVIRETIDRWKWELQILDGQSTNHLYFLIDEKEGVLSLLSSKIHERRIPLPMGDELLFDDQGVVTATPDNYITAHGHSLLNELSLDLDANSVPMEATWGEEDRRVVENYFAIRDPRARMDEIRSSIENIRKVLESSFTITDVLLRVGDPRLRGNRYRYREF